MRSGYYAMQPQRPKRFVAVAARGALQGLKKYGPELLLTVVAAYQLYENEKLEGQVQELKKRLVNLSKLTLKLNKVEFETLGEQLQAIELQEKQIKVESDINVWSSTLQTLISTQSARHHNLELCEPLAELQKYVSSVNEQERAVRMPSTDESARLFSNRRRVTENGQVTVVFKIPMVKAQQYEEYAFITIPDSNGTAVELDDARMTIKLAFDMKNETVFSTDYAQYLFDNIYERVNIKKTNDCISAILKSNHSSISRQCGKFTWPKDADKISFLREDLAVVYTNNARKYTIKCPPNDTLSLHDKAAILKISLCDMSDGIINWSASRSSTTATNETTPERRLAVLPPHIEIKPFHVDPRINEW